MKLKMPSLFVKSFAVALLASSAFHVSAETDSQQLRACMDSVDYGGMKNTQWASCYLQEFKRQDTRLNATYKSLHEKVSPEAKESLIKAQRSWIAFRDGWCAYIEALDYAPNGAVNRVACMMELTSEQEKKLRESAF